MDRAEIERRWAWGKPFASRYGLAVLCVAGPLIFGSVAPDLALRYLMPGTPHTLVALLPHAPPDAIGSRFDFRPDVSAKSDRAAATSGAPSKDRGAEETDEIVARDRNTLFGARDIGGRVRYVVASAFLCAVSIAAFGYGAAVVVRRRGRLPSWGPWAVFGGFALLSIWLAFNSAGFERIRPLIVESILEAADAKQAWQTASRALVLVRINTWVALVAVGTLLTALYTASRGFAEAPRNRPLGARVRLGDSRHFRVRQRDPGRLAGVAARQIAASGIEADGRGAHVAAGCDGHHRAVRRDGAGTRRVHARRAPLSRRHEAGAGAGATIRRAAGRAGTETGAARR